jgi:hypothetical protein
MFSGTKNGTARLFWGADAGAKKGQQKQGWAFHVLGFDLKH